MVRAPRHGARRGRGRSRRLHPPPTRWAVGSTPPRRRRSVAKGRVVPRHFLARPEGELSYAKARSFSQSESLLAGRPAFARLHVRHSSFSESPSMPRTRSWIVSSAERRSWERKWRVDEHPELAHGQAPHRNGEADQSFGLGFFTMRERASAGFLRSNPARASPSTGALAPAPSAPRHRASRCPSLLFPFNPNDPLPRQMAAWRWYPGGQVTRSHARTRGTALAPGKCADAQRIAAEAIDGLLQEVSRPLETGPA